MENGVIKIGGDYSGFTEASKNAMTQAQRDSKTFVDAAEREMKRLDRATDSLAAHERQVKSTLELDIQRLKASGRDSEIKHIENVLSYKKKVADYEKLGFSTTQAASMSMQSLKYEDQIAARQKAAELAKNIETSQASLNAQRLRELETAKQIAEKQASIAASNAKEQVALQKKIQLMAAVASGDKQREQHLRAMASLEKNVQLGLNAGLKPSEALQQARTMLRLEQSISQEKQKQQSIGGGPGGAAYTGARRGSAFMGGQNAAYRVGMISQQAQDVAVSLQMGMSASRVIAQQGSQIASIFGPTGMVIGGVIAIGAAIAEWAFNTKEADEAAQKYKKTHEEIEEIAKRNAKQSIQNEAALVALQSGPLAGKKRLEELEFEQKQKEIQDKRNEVLANAAEKRRARAGWHWTRSLDFDTSTSDAKRELLKLEDEEYLAAQKINIAREEAAIKRNTEADLAIIKTQQQIDIDEETSESGKKSLKDYYDFKNRLSEIDMSDQSDINKYLLSQAEENAYAAKQELEERAKNKEAADNYLKQAEKEVKINEEKYKEEQKVAHFRDTSIKKYSRAQSELAKLEQEVVGYEERNTPEHQLEVAKKRLEILEAEKGAVQEIESARSEAVEFQKASLAGTEAQNKRKVIEMEIDLLKKKIAFSPLEAQQIANRLELLRREQVNENFAMGAMGATGMQQSNRSRKAQEREKQKAEQRAIDNMGLIDIHRGMNGEIIGGTDPVTGKKLTKKEIEERKAAMEAEKARREMERAAARGDEVAQERLKRVNWGNGAGGANGQIAAGFSPEQITALSKSIADAVLALQAK